ncbi:MAG: hypothetical protein K1Y36_18740 [Blastocatellia bacterium]|nr:hypothetical protein [Blastocatellia bacterium]
MKSLSCVNPPVLPIRLSHCMAAFCLAGLLGVTSLNQLIPIAAQAQESLPPVNPAGKVEVVSPHVTGIAPLIGPVPPNSGFAVKVGQSSGLLSFAGAVNLLNGTAPALFTAYDTGIGTINYADLAGSSAPVANFGNDRDIRQIPGHLFGVGGQDNFAIRATGALLIPTAGTWTFTVNSDDGCRLTMGSNHLIVIDAPFTQPPTDRSGLAEIVTPGWYPFQLDYFEGGGGAEVEFFANGPGQPANVLVGDPAGVLQVRSGALSGVLPAAGQVPGNPGFSVKVCQQAASLSFNTALDLLNGNTPTLFTAFDNGVGTMNYIDVLTNTPAQAGSFGNDRDIRLIPGNGFGSGDQNNYAIRATGLLFIPAGGTWTFTVNQDDGCRFSLGANLLTVVDSPNYQGGLNVSRSVDIPGPGYYPFRFDFYEGGGGSYVELSASGPGQPTRLLVGDPAGTLRVFQNSVTGVQTTRIFVADTYNQRVQRFENGSWTQVGEPGQFMFPEAVTANLSGTWMYVADTGNNKIQYSTDGGATWTDLTSPGQVTGPQGLALDVAGNLYVSDTGGNRVLRFAGGIPSVAPLVLAGPGNAPGQVLNPRGLAVDPSGNLFIADQGNSRILRVPNAGTLPGVAVQVAGKGSGTLPFGQVNAPEGLALDNNGNLYVADTGNNRVIRFAGGNGGGATLWCSLSTSFLNPALGQVRGAEGVTVCDASLLGGSWGSPALIVADSQNHRLQGTVVGSGQWSLVGLPNGSGTNAGQFRTPGKVR